MTDIIIPKEALGAAAHHAAITIYRLVDPDTRAHELTEDELGEVALAAIRAAIEAWPRMVQYPVMEIDCTPSKIVLPLPQKEMSA